MDKAVSFFLLTKLKNAPTPVFKYQVVFYIISHASICMFAVVPAVKHRKVTTTTR